MTEARPPSDDATAQTLNYALGNLGGKQKSWMVLPSDAPSVIAPAELARNPLPFTVRGRGRPRKQPVPLPARQPQHQPQTTNTARPTIEPQAERQPPSNSTSPQLANIVTPHTPSTFTELPSPTPSEESMNHLPGTSLETIFMESVRRSGSLSKRPMDEEAQQAEKRSRTDAFGQERPLAMAGTMGMPSPTVAGPQHADFPRRTSYQLLQNGSPSLAQTYSRSPSLGNQSQISSPQLPHGMQLRDPRASGTPPQSQAPFAQPRTLSLGGTRHPLSVPIDTDRAPMPQGEPSAQPYSPPSNWYTRQECLHILENFRLFSSVLPDYPRDGIRLAVLKDATEQQDWPYLIMHQYYCLLHSAPDTLPAGLRSQPNLRQAISMLSNVLDLNQTLSFNFLRFFSNYPYPIQEIEARWPAMHRHQTEMFLSFIAQSPDYETLKRACARRRFPPLARELAVDLKIASKIFQRLSFTAIWRHIWQVVPRTPLQSSFEAQIVNIFLQNQNDYYKRQQIFTANVQVFGPQYAQKEKELELRTWGPRLKEVIGRFETELTLALSLENQYTGVSQQQQQLAYSHFQPQQTHGIPRLSYPNEMPPRPSRSADPQSAQAALQQPRGRGCPPSRPVQPTQLVTQQPYRAPAQLPRSPVPLLPMPGWIQPQQRQPHPERFSLHQAQLQSPVLRAKSVLSPLYGFQDGFIKPPTRLTKAGRAIEKWTFELSPDAMQNIPQTVYTTPGGPGTRDVDENSKTVRLRCIKWSGSHIPEDHVWAVANTSWIPHSYFILNGTSLQQRKRVHNGKDLPIDLTGLLKEGGNVLEIAVLALSADTSYFNYLVAIETVGFSSQNSIKQHCLTQNHASAEQVVQAIKDKLSSKGDDDEICVVQNNLTIGLFDPFGQASICAIPVRGKACPHNDCFDLDIFLQTRRQKGDASVPDLWKCPICNADARPHMLMVDGFLEDVKRQLEAQGLAGTRYITIQQDGTWKPKAQVREGVFDDREASDEPPTPDKSQRASIPAHAEVIDLSD
ncbi:hypothetical protein EJ02DRAFT_49316 [Clathrospora elynae]|uniref:SP-RING-type domain-containing protein n=1 Tax=Clathrospora elynae TaxID=706981 RepID=A0A6A5SAK2_9PLEO|nr:hypothetical protein EJ02DRAFT_49316 [Clathrospora elynae]